MFYGGSSFIDSYFGECYTANKGVRIQMKTIGLLGGMSWESTVSYYQIINREIAKQLGGLHSAKCLLYSVDFNQIEQLQSQENWERCGEILGEAALILQQGGADFLVICSNTIHRVVQQIQSRISIPILHIADATANQLKLAKIQTVGLLGTRYTMQQEFYRSRLQEQNINVLLPGLDEMEKIHQIIFQELCLGILNDSSREELQRIIQALSKRGADGIILGCTELGLLLAGFPSPLPLFDTAEIHARCAAFEAMKES